MQIAGVNIFLNAFPGARGGGKNTNIYKGTVKKKEKGRGKGKREGDKGR